MIMGGRGRRITGDGQESNKTNKPAGLSQTPGSSSNKSSLVTLINEINITGVNTSVFPKIQSCVNEVFTTKEAMKKILSDLHDKALGDPQFGEKFVLALEQVSNFEVEGSLLRNELLSFIQNDFKLKETLFQSDRQKFLNAVLLLGGVFNRIKICNEPIGILGVALLEYFDVLMKGDEVEFKTLTKQIFINGEKLRKINRFELVEHDLRKIIINENLDTRSKCWILLAIDFVSHGCKPLKGIVKNFYVANLGEEFKKCESLVSNNGSNQLASPTSKGAPKEEKNQTPSSPGKKDNFESDLSVDISDLNLKSDKGNKERIQSPPGKSNKKDYWKPTRSGQRTGHDDRFEREENFYGVQKPRQPRLENQRKNFSDTKANKKGSDFFSSDYD